MEDFWELYISTTRNCPTCSSIGVLQIFESPDDFGEGICKDCAEIIFQQYPNMKEKLKVRK